MVRERGLKMEIKANKQMIPAIFDNSIDWVVSDEVIKTANKETRLT